MHTLYLYSLVVVVVVVVIIVLDQHRTITKLADTLVHMLQEHLDSQIQTASEFSLIEAHHLGQPPTLEDAIDAPLEHVGYHILCEKRAHLGAQPIGACYRASDTVSVPECWTLVMVMAVAGSGSLHTC
jgi:hypothetical protein